MATTTTTLPYIAATGELSERQIEMAQAAEMWISGWQAADGEAVADVMLDTAVVHYPSRRRTTVFLPRG